MEISRENISGTGLQEYGRERYIKIPIDNYLSLIDIEPVPPQIALINAINNPDFRFVTAVLSRRTGKSFMSNIIGQLVVLVPGCNILMIAPNYSLSQISWDIQSKLLNTFAVETDRRNAKDRIIELKNGSTIRIGSVGQVDSVVGRSYDLIIFDEAALNEDGENAFNVALLPTLDRPNSKTIFISTPRGKNWFYDFYKRGYSDKFPEWASILSTYKDNPRVNMQNVEDARKALSAAEFAQEYECDFIALEGQIYNLNKDNITEINADEINKYDVVAGLDLGYKDPTAMVVLITDGHSWYLVDEYVKGSITTSVHAEKIQKLIDKWEIDFIYADSAQAQQRADLAYDYDICTSKANKSRLDGLNYVASFIDNDRLFVDKKCIDSIEMFDNYRWDDREGLLKDRPLHDKHSHIADAIRYAIYSHKANLTTLGD